MMISIGSDHRGFDLKTKIIQGFDLAESVSVEWLDVGTYSEQRVDYPIFAKKVCKNILDGKTDLGVLICGSGIGMAIAANRFKNIYAAPCWNKDIARLARQDDGANIITLPANFISEQEAFNIIAAWLEAKFKGAEYQRRLEMVDK